MQHVRGPGQPGPLTQPVRLLYPRHGETHPYPLPVVLRDRARWRTSFVVLPRSNWVVWQVHCLARIHGIDGRVDLDVVRADRP